MAFLSSVKLSFIRYIQFSDRATRVELLWWVLFRSTIMVIAILIDISYDTFIFHLVVGPVSGVIGSITLLPSLSLGVRRLHDVNRSGWWILAGLLFPIGSFMLIKWLLEPGDSCRNRYGNNPYVSNLQKTKE